MTGTIPVGVVRPAARDLLYAVVAMGLAAYLWVGVGRLPPAHRGPWRWAAAGVAAGVAADLGTTVVRQALAVPPFPSVVHLLFPP